MTGQHDDFRDRLKAAQHFTPEYRQKFERSMKQMVEKQLTPAQRVGVLFVTLFSLAGVAAMAWVAVTFQISLPFGIAFGLLGSVVLVIALIRAKTAITGKDELRTQPRVIAWIGWFGVLFYLIALMLALPTMGRGFSEYFTVLALFPLIVMAAQLIQMSIGQSKLAVSEKLLEMELRLAEMNEKLDRQAR